MISTSLRRSATVTLTVAAIAAAPLTGNAQDFYRGRTITIVAGYSAGGRYDRYARVLARHIGRAIPGNPTLVVQNMPGAAGFTAARYLATSAPRDGTVITVFDP